MEPPTSCEAIARTLTSLGANAASHDEKIRNAFHLLEAEDDCNFPDRFGFVVDWLGGAMKGKNGRPERGEVAPRFDVRFWRVLDKLFYRYVGRVEPDDDAALVEDPPPAWNLAQLDYCLCERVTLSSRVYLQAAQSALQYACSPAELAQSPHVVGPLCARLRRAMYQLLSESTLWFQPGPEATVEYASGVCASVSQLLECDLRALSAAAHVACEQALLACIDALLAVLRLQSASGEATPRKVLGLFTSSLLRPALGLRAACAHLINEAALLQQAVPAPSAGAGAAASSTASSSASTSPLLNVLPKVQSSVDSILCEIMLHADHVPEYISAIRRLAALDSTGAAALPASSAKAKKKQKKAKGGEGDEGGGDASAAAAAAAAQANYTAVTLNALHQIRVEEVAKSAARGAAAARGALVPMSDRALLAPVQPLLARGYREMHKRQQARIQEDRDFRERLKRKKRGAAESEEPPPAAGVDFIFFRWFLSNQLAETDRAVQSALGAFASSDTGSEAAAAALFSAAEAAGATAALLDCARTHGIYRPREDSSGEQRQAITESMAVMVRLATSLHSRGAYGFVENASQSGAMAWRQAHASTCSAFDALLAMDALIVRPHLPVLIALLAFAGPEQVRTPQPSTLTLNVVRSLAAQRQLPMLLRLLATQAGMQPYDGITQHVGLGALMRCAPFWQALASVVAECAEAQAPELCSSITAAIEGGTGGDGVAHASDVVWQICCVMASVFDAVPVGTFTASALDVCAARGLALADVWVDKVREDSGRGAAAASCWKAAAMLSWRASAALRRTCMDMLNPGSWGQMIGVEKTPRALALAHDLFTVADGERGGGASAISTETAAVRFAAADAVAYEVEWTHMELEIARATHMDGDDGEDEREDADGDRGGGAGTRGHKMHLKHMKRLQKALRSRTRLLLAWDPAEGRRAAKQLRPASEVAACAEGADSFASHWLLLCNRAAMLDLYGSDAQLQRWLSLLIQSWCNADAMQHNGNRETDDVSNPEVTMHSVSSRLLSSAQLYELHRVRLLLLPSAWTWLQKRFGGVADAVQEDGNKRVAKWLEFVLGALPSRLGSTDGSTASDVEEQSGADANDGAAWVDLIGHTSLTRGMPAIGEGTWTAIATLLELIVSMPHETLPSQHVGWLLPRVIVLAHLASADCNNPSSAQVRVLFAAFRFASWIVSACPAAAAGVLGGKALRRILLWCLRLPMALTTSSEGVRGESAKTHKANGRLSPFARRLASETTLLVGALSAASIAAGFNEPFSGDATTSLTMTKSWGKWLDAVSESLNAEPVTSDGTFGYGYTIALESLTIHLTALASHVARMSPESPSDGWHHASAWLSELNAKLCVLRAERGERGDGRAIRCFELGLRQSSSAEADDVLCGVFECSAIWLRCHNTIRSRLTDKAPPPSPPHLSASIRRTISTLGQGAVPGRHPQLVAAALSLIDVLSERDGILHAAHTKALNGRETTSATAVALDLSFGERCDLLHALLVQIEPTSRYHQMTPSGRVRAADSHLPLAIFRRLLTSVGEREEERLGKVADAAEETRGDAGDTGGLDARHNETVDERLQRLSREETDEGRLQRLWRYDQGVDRLESSSGAELIAWMRNYFINRGAKSRRVVNDRAEDFAVSERSDADKGWQGDLYSWALETMLGRVNPRETPARLRSTLLGIAVACSTVSPYQLRYLKWARCDVIASVVDICTRGHGQFCEGFASDEIDSIRTASLQALTALVTNGRVRFQGEGEKGGDTDGEVLLFAANHVANHVATFHDPEARAPLPSTACFEACYFLVTAMLRQRSQLINNAIPMLLMTHRGLLHTLVNRPSAEEARTLRRLLEAFVPHRRVFLRFMKFPLAELLTTLRDRPLPAAVMKELLPGIHALLGMCSEYEVQWCHTNGDYSRQQLLKEWLESYEQSFKYKGKA